MGSKIFKFMLLWTFISFAACQVIPSLYASEFDRSHKAIEISGLIDTLATFETAALYLNLKKYTQDKLLFGHQDATAYGVGWWDGEDSSDIKLVTGSHPAVYGWDLGDIGNTENLDGVNFKRMKELIIEAHARGGIITITMHLDNPATGGNAWDNSSAVPYILPGKPLHDSYLGTLSLIADFFNSLKAADSTFIPVIFRPYHEHNQGWSWWGTSACTSEEYIALWQMTVKYFRDENNIHHLIYTISPQDISSEATYLQRYPGDDYVDILGLDYYMLYSTANVSALGQVLEMLTTLADNRAKISALTETGVNQIPTSNWWTSCLREAVRYSTQSEKIAWALVWRNANTNHFFAPYPGHPSVPDFLQFFNDDFTLFQNNMPDFYNIVPDSVAPKIIDYPDGHFFAYETTFKLTVRTDKPAFLKYGPVDVTYENLSFNFDQGGGTLEHTAYISVSQNESYTFFLRASDYYGNTSETSTNISFTVDTLQRPVYWYDPLYPVDEWETNTAPFSYAGVESKETLLPWSRTAYFRRDFDLQDTSGMTQLVAMTYYDNGAVFYLNGHEVHRLNMSARDIEYETWALSDKAGVQSVTFNNEDIRYLRNGKNILGVEMHQAKNDSLDLLFDLKLISPDVLIDYGSDWKWFSAGKLPDPETVAAVGIDDSGPFLPTRLNLYQNYPNPFNPSTLISYHLSAAGFVDLSIYNISGQKIATLISGKQQMGTYKLKWDTSGFPSGTYFYRLSSTNRIETKKMVLIK